MPYIDNHALPASVKNHLPEHAQTIYREAFNHAYALYQDERKRKNKEDRETIAHRVAWSAVEKKYTKGTNGQWIAK
jgi:cation transport regulator